MDILKALKNRYRFDAPQGKLNIEQLFDLGKTDLDNIYTKLQSKLKTSNGLMDRKTGNSEIQNKMDIVQAIFELKVAAENKKTEAAEKKRLKEFILGKAAEKQMSELTEGKSYKQLMKLAEKM